MSMRMEGGKQYQKKGLWTAEEDKILTDYVKLHGKGQWNRVAKRTGLKRCGKSCRLRWMNYLSPTVNRGNFTEEEEDLIIRLHKLLGNRWSLIAKRVPGRTDNQVKNYWNTHLSKKLGIRKQSNSNRSRNVLLPSLPQNSSPGSDKVSETSTISASSSISNENTISGAGEVKVDGGSSSQEQEAVIDASESQKITTSGGYADSFCGFDCEFELSGISTMYFLNQYAVEFDWQCL